MDPTFIAIAFGCGLAVYLINLPPLIGFLAVGFVLNAMGYASNDTLDMLANLGVTLLLFSIGLKLDLRVLLRKEVWGTSFCRRCYLRWCCWALKRWALAWPPSLNGVKPC